MIKNYFKTAFRNIIRHKGYSFINITGLAIGLASCLLITFWIANELSYDRFHKDAPYIYHVLAHGRQKTTLLPLLPWLRPW